MPFGSIDSAISATGVRSCELLTLRLDSNVVTVELLDEDSHRWRLTFRDTQATKVTTEECAIGMTQLFPPGGGVFVADESDWLTGLGKGLVHFLDQSRHFAVPCYDEVVEVVAWTLEIECLENGEAP